MSETATFNFEHALRKPNGDNVYAVWLSPWRDCIGRVESFNRREGWRIECGPQGRPISGVFTSRGDAAMALHAVWLAQQPRSVASP